MRAVGGRALYLHHDVANEEGLESHHPADSRAIRAPGCAGEQ
jgi:hypothetical protein